MTGQSDLRGAGESRVPGPAHRSYGTLDTITDSGKRALRPIGTTARDVALRTGALLSELLALPAVWTFHGLRAAQPDGPRIPHAIGAGGALVLVESVAWPPGRYLTGPTGKVHCDGVYIGQSARPLAEAVRHWRAVLPHGHQVSAIVVVHPAGDGDLELPGAAGHDVTWVRPDEAMASIRSRLTPGRRELSAEIVAALAAATAAGPGAGDRVAT